MGMDVVRTNLTELGGQVRVESQVGQGTLFRVFLPRHATLRPDAGSSAPLPPASLTPPPHLSARR